MSKRRPVDLFVVGRGVRDGTGQMTLEAVEALKTCRVVLDLSADPDAVRAIHPNVVDLAEDYWTFDVNEDVYARIERIVLDEVRRGGPTVGHITDGHPLLFDDVNREPALKAGRLFVYQRNVERTLETPSLLAIEDASVKFLAEELEFVKKGPPPT